MGHTPRNVRGDSASQASNVHEGRTFEKIIERCNDWYRARALAVIAIVPVPVIVTGRGGARVIGNGPVDWMGVVNDGRAIAFDTKTTVTERFNLSKPKLVRGRRGMRMTQGQLHQAKFLIDWRDCGGLGGFLVHQRDEGRVYLIDDLTSLQRLEHGESVRITKKGEALFPYVGPSSTLDIAKGTKPEYDYLELFRGQLD